tara:strand:- start:3663 stop:4385 length:723 start_codon:yes stop_codon:yes gene_type:complete
MVDNVGDYPVGVLRETQIAMVIERMQCVRCATRAKISDHLPAPGVTLTDNGVDAIGIDGSGDQFEPTTSADWSQLLTVTHRNELGAGRRHRGEQGACVSRRQQAELVDNQNGMAVKDTLALVDFGDKRSNDVTVNAEVWVNTAPVKSQQRSGQPIYQHCLHRPACDNVITISVDGRGALRDNVFVERLWRSIKYEEVYLRAYNAVSHARASIGKYLVFYNGRRPYSGLDRITPDEAYGTR